jgi:quercetin dioxygenase-like cupin family protein
MGAILAALAAVPADGEVLPSRTYRFEDLPVRQGATAISRAAFRGETHSGFEVGVHQTELAPGQMPHPAHKHVHEEMVLVREGKLEVTIADRSTVLGPGSVAYVASNEQHGWRNVGSVPATYFVIALGSDK